MTLDELFQSAYVSAHSARAVRAATWMAAALLIFSAAQTVERFLPRAAVDAGYVEAMPAPVTPLPDIAAWHLFGDYGALLPKTQLQLVLQGVFVSSNEGVPSQALISSPDGPAKLYNVGDQVGEGAKIHAILKTSVVLEHNGKLETLPLPVPELQLGPPPRDLGESGRAIRRDVTGEIR